MCAMYWEPEIETMPRAKIQEIQRERLRNILEYVYQRVPFYREKFDIAGVKPSDFRDLEDITKFPFTNKDDLRRAYPYKMFAVPLREVVRVHASSGTLVKLPLWVIREKILRPGPT